MSLLRIIWKFISRRGADGRTAWSAFLPIGGVILGTLVVSLTFAIMDGLESEIYGRLQQFSSLARLDVGALDPGDQAQVRRILTDQEIPFYRTIERNGILKVEDRFRIVKVRSIERFKEYLQAHLNITLDDTLDDPIIVGQSLANRLGVYRSSRLKLVSPLDISLVTGIPPQKSLTVQDIFELELVDFDLNFAFIPYAVGKEIFHHSPGEILLLDAEVPAILVQRLNHEYPELTYSSWQGDYQDLMSAMRLEKIAYTMFGFMIVFLAGFNLLSVMSMSVMRKIPQIGLLLTMGFPRRKIRKIFLVQSLFTGISGALIGLLLAETFILLEGKLHFLNYLLASFPMSEYPLELTLQKGLITGSVSILLVLISGIYPAVKAARLDPVTSIEYIK